MYHARCALSRVFLSALLVGILILAAAPALADEGGAVSPAQVAPDVGPISVNVSANGGSLTVPADQWVEVEFSVFADSQAEVEAWYRDSVHTFYLDGEAIAVTGSHELGSALVTVGDALYWYGGFRVPVGQLSPGQHNLYWIANLSAERATVNGVYAPGAHNFALTLFVEEADVVAVAQTAAASPSGDGRVDPVQVAPDVAPVSVNSRTGDDALTVPADQWVEVEFSIFAASQEEVEAWYRDSVHTLYLDGEEIAVTEADELGSALVSVGDVAYWYGGFRVPVGQLSPGQHNLYWIANLSAARDTVDGPYAAGAHDFALTLFVE